MPNWIGTKWRPCETLLVSGVEVESGLVSPFHSDTPERKLKDTKQPIIHQSVEPEGDEAAGFKK